MDEMNSEDLRKRIKTMHQQFELDKKMFIAHFQPEVNSLQQHYRLQLQKHLQIYLSRQEQIKNFDQFKLFIPNNELVYAKYKEKNEESAVASAAVKRHLQNFVIGRQIEKQNGSSSDLSMHCSLNDDLGTHFQSNGLNQSSYKEKCCFPLRKTASEPNLKPKYRMKKKLSTDHRQSPLLNRPDSKEVKMNLANHIKQRLSSEIIAENSSLGSIRTHSESRLTKLQKESNPNRMNVDPQPDDQINDIRASPSLPNIPFSLANKTVHSFKDSRLISRTPSLPAALVRIPSQEELSTTSPGNEAASMSSFHGPIRAPQLARPHKTLNRARSAPSSATASYLQQHILQKRQAKALKQQLQDEKIKSSLTRNKVPFSIPIYNDSDSEESKSRLQEKSPFTFLSNGKITSTRAMATVKQAITVTGPTFKTELNPSAIFSQVSSSNMDEHRTLHRARTSPVTSFMKKLPAYKKYRNTTGIAYNPVMLRHGCACGDDHIENGGRLRAVWDRLLACGLVGNNSSSGEFPCELTETRKAMLDEMQLVHSQEHTLRYGTTSLARKELNLRSQLVVLPCGGVGVDNGIDEDTVWNELDTVNAARMAVGCTVDLALLVAQNQLKNGFALVRPPGHHAQKDLAMAFCFFNSVAVTARKLQSSGCARKVLILDWDIHHCNGTQNIFYDDPSVLVISIHRYDRGNFFPGTGAPDEVGCRQGIGFNVNIALSGGVYPPMGDAEYLSAFRSLILPIGKQFSPDLVLVSAGFSAAAGHPSALGGYNVSPQCFGYLTSLVMELAKGKVVLVLEGGFELDPLCDCVETCVRTLLKGGTYTKLSDNALTSLPNDASVSTIKNAIRVQSKHWMNLNQSHVAISHADWLSVTRETETCNALASLTVNNSQQAEHMTNTAEATHVSPPPSPTTMDQDDGSLKVEKSTVNRAKSPSDVSIGSASPLLDVVGTSGPPTPQICPDEENDDNCSLNSNKMS